MNIPWWRSHPIHENRATLSICTEPCNPWLRATKSTKRATKSTKRATSNHEMTLFYIIWFSNSPLEEICLLKELYKMSFEYNLEWCQRVDHYLICLTSFQEPIDYSKWLIFYRFLIVSLQINRFVHIHWWLLIRIHLKLIDQLWKVSSYIFCNALESLLLQFPETSMAEYYVWASPSNTEKKSSRYCDEVHWICCISPHCIVDIKYYPPVVRY